MRSPFRQICGAELGRHLDRALVLDIETADPGKFRTIFGATERFASDPSLLELAVPLANPLD
jgi:hypothetical protein